MADAARAPARALEVLAEEDARLARVGIVRLSLAPGRDHARPLRVVGEELVARAVDVAPDVVRLWAEGLVALSRTIGESFPDNLFFDIDAVAASLLESGEEGGAAAVEERVELLVDLHELFGRRTTIRFRYVHDFLYGFDWAKWIQRSPEGRVGTGPFDVAFLRAMRARGEELLSLIESDDPTYPRLRDERPRNPFGFSREPPDELVLFRDLSCRGLLPVEAFRLSGPWEWHRPYAALREERARALGLCAAAPPGR